MASPPPLGRAEILPYGIIRPYGKSFNYLFVEARRADDGYLAYFPALRGCNTWGRTYEEAVDNAREALTGYLETLHDLGKPFPSESTNEPISLGLTVRMPIIA